MTFEHVLAGCRAEPLGSYLKALGVLKLVGGQADPNTTGRWVADTFILATDLTAEELLAFFLDRYVPTPVVSPWNSSSGFGKEGERELQLLEKSPDERLVPYRRTIEGARSLLARQQLPVVAMSSQTRRSDGWTPRSCSSAMGAILPIRRCSAQEGTTADWSSLATSTVA
jgi:CRISPR-associated protein Csx17